MIPNKTRTNPGLILRLAVSCLCFMAVVTTASAQSGTVIIPTRETTIKQALDEIQRQTDYSIVVNWGDLNPERRVFFPSQRLQIKELLRICLEGTAFTWELSGDKIVITYLDDGHADRSAMARNGFQRTQMKFVPDPWSRNQRPFDNMFNTRKAEWRYGSAGQDSVGLVVINYRVNSSVVEKDYMDNARALEIIRRTLTNKDVLASLDYIVVTAGSSPEGNTAANEKLAADRALAMKSYLMWQYPFLERDMIYTFSIGEDWTGLRKMVAEDRYTPYREEVLYTLDHVSGDDAKRARLKSIGGGAAYRYILMYMLPKLRGAAAATLHFKEPQNEKVIETHTVDTLYVDRIVEKKILVPQEVELEPKPMFAIKTNLLFDVASALNAEIEIPIGKRWSIAGEYVFPWWLWEKKQIAVETLYGTLEVRYWFGDRTDRKQLTGWFMGLYGGGGYYDLEWKDKGYQGEFFHVGLSGGYAHTISRNGNWRMEYSLGIGYLGTKYREYVPKFGADGEWHLIRQNNGNYRWIGPTRAKVSLVWMINNGYRKKGGSK